MSETHRHIDRYHAIFKRCGAFSLHFALFVVCKAYDNLIIKRKAKRDVQI